MARGTAGYGRYDSDPAHVGCPWALASRRTSEAPCIARDGKLGMLGGQCVSCGKSILSLFTDLADDYRPAEDALSGPPFPGLEQAADKFRDLVYEATAPLAGGEHEPGPAPGAAA